MTTPLSREETVLEADSTVKAVWTRPTLEVADINASTQAGGAASADSDPNQPS